MIYLTQIRIRKDFNDNMFLKNILKILSLKNQNNFIDLISNNNFLINSFILILIFPLLYPLRLLFNFNYKDLLAKFFK